MRRTGWALVVFASIAAGVAIAQERSPLEPLPCGPKPIPEPGCHIVGCKQGEWKQSCAEDDEIRCGIKPIPDFGCYIGECKVGRWEQICDPSADIPCGPRPIPPVGCRIGKCIAGQWEQVCNDPMPITPLD